MQIDELKSIARENGIVGAGGAGFPAYAKMTDKADTVILNCVECEPLLKLHRQLLAAHTEEIIGMLDEVREAFGAKEAVVGIKSEYVTTIKAVEAVLGKFPKVRICALKAAYPMGDEVVLIYEATGRVIKPGGLPIDENVVVYNVETMYNIIQGQVEASEFIVKENSPIAGKPLAELTFKKNVLIACITRENQVIIPRGQDVIKAGDAVVIVSKQIGLQDVTDVLK